MVQLSTLARGAQARITGIEGDDGLMRKLLEMGFHEGMELTLLHEGPLGRRRTERVCEDLRERGRARLQNRHSLTPS